MQKITPHLTLNSIEANNWEYDDDIEITTCWCAWFTFFGHESFYALVTKDKIDLPYASWGYIESPEGSLHDSFVAQIEEHWETIVKFIKKWEEDHLAVQKFM